MICFTDGPGSKTPDITKGSQDAQTDKIKIYACNESDKDMQLILRRVFGYGCLFNILRKRPALMSGKMMRRIVLIPMILIAVAIAVCFVPKAGIQAYAAGEGDNPDVPYEVGTPM